MAEKSTHAAIIALAPLPYELPPEQVQAIIQTQIDAINLSRSIKAQLTELTKKINELNHFHFDSLIEALGKVTTDYEAARTILNMRLEVKDGEA